MKPITVIPEVSQNPVIPEVSQNPVIPEVSDRESMLVKTGSSIKDFEDDDVGGR